MNVSLISSLRRVALLAVALSVGIRAAGAAPVVIAPEEDVMTSSFFTGTNLVRGYDADDRNVHRVSTDAPFGSPGGETIYVTFDYDFAGNFSLPIGQALLTMESTSGGFGADASAVSPFTVSAHAVDADPIASITDDTNPGGPIDWLTFFDNDILPADPAALTTIDGFGTVTFDVTSIVNDWISGSSTVLAIALTGKNDASGNDFLHGFLNNSENPGATYLTVTPVPEPASIVLAAIALAGLAACRLRGRRRQVRSVA